MDPERIESLKAGGVAALTGAGVSALLVTLHPNLLPPNTLSAGLLRIAVATVCAFLFGVTYRYIVRNDSNPHLRSGAVGAFALTRSLGQLEGISPADLVLSDALPLALPIIESFGLFMCLRLILDWGLQQQWFRPFESD
ncbi:MAG: hypothetical protein AAGA46_03770 [Cyanobacteria bacterium P01_F01_bin.13]